MDLIFRMPCILLTCIYVHLCVCKYIEASEQGCSVVKVCYLYSNIKSAPSATLLLHISYRKSLWEKFWKWKSALCELQLQSVFRGESSVT